MTKREYQDWKSKLEESRNRLSEQPDNPALAAETWAMLEGPDYYDYKSGNEALSIFRDAALASNEGVVQLAYAFKELAEKTGEPARKESFDRELLLAVEKACEELEGTDKDAVLWLKYCIN